MLSFTLYSYNMHFVVKRIVLGVIFTVHGLCSYYYIDPDKDIL